MGSLTLIMHYNINLFFKALSKNIFGLNYNTVKNTFFIFIYSEYELELTKDDLSQNVCKSIENTIIHLHYFCFANNRL